MKHINKNPEALIINVEFPGYGSSSGLPLVATVYNIDKGLWMCHTDPTTGSSIYTYPGPPALPVYAWSSLAPGTGSWAGPPGPTPTGYEAYEVPLAEMNYVLGMFGDGKYWINLTAAHDSLDRNDGSVVYASDCASLPNWDASVSPSGAIDPPGPGFAGSKGYLIRISNASNASGILMPTPPIYIHLTVDQATRDVNVVEWLGVPVTASPAGFPDVNVHEYKAAAVSPAVAGTPDVNVIEVMSIANAADGLKHFGTTGYDMATSTVARVDTVNTLAAGSIGSTSMVADAIHATAIADDAIHADTIAGGAIHSGNSTGATPAIAEGAIHKNNNGEGGSLPAIEGDAIHATAIADDAIHADTIAGGAIHSGNSTGSTPAIAEGAIHKNNNGEGGSLPAIEGDAIHATAIADDAIHADTIEVAAIHNQALAAGAIHAGFTDSGGTVFGNAIEDDAIHATAIADDAIHADTIAGGAIHSGNSTGATPAIAEGAIHKNNNGEGTMGPAIEDDAIHDAALAENAINEEAIKIDSVTYEEISNSAIREIVSGVWNADVFKPIDVSVDGGGSRNYSGTNYANAGKGSVGHAMLLQYISQNILHWDAADGALTSLHQCSHDDPTGTRFYSASLPALSADVAKGYIDKAAVVVKNWTIDSDANGDEEFYLVRITGIGADAHGNFIEIHMVDEDESPIPSGGLLSGTDALLIKEETDSTMHEVAHEVWEESVFDHETPDTFGMLNRIMAGLSQFNHQITDSMYDESGRLLSCRLVVYASSDDARDGINPLTTIEVSSSYDEKQNMKTFVSAEEKKAT